MVGAMKADYAGFNGRVLQVSSSQPSLLPRMCNFESSAEQS